MTYADRDFHRYTRSYWRNCDTDERRAIVDENLELINQGVEEWNEFDTAFAEYIKKHNILDPYYYFEGASFSGNANFRGATFSGDVDFKQATFNEYAYFREATFSGDVDFEQATFNEYANFEKATFSGAAYFNEANFSGDVDFQGATFSGHVDFEGATFNEDVDFQGAIFSEDADFRGANFSRDTHFEGATFSREAFFMEATFSGRAHFEGATFDGRSFFIGVENKSILDLTNVTAKNSVPIFSGMEYKIPPIIDGLSVPEPDGNSDSYIASYRQLKMIAIAGANHEMEVEFFGYETQCKLYLDETPMLSRLLIKSYRFFSNFGQSVWRPALGLGVIFLVACVLTRITVEAGYDPVACENAEYTGAFGSKSEAALSQSIDFILPILKADRGTLRQRNQCLYGHDGVPGINRVINFIQQIVSLVFLFLAGLAIRNRFKIK